MAGIPALCALNSGRLLGALAFFEHFKAKAQAGDWGFKVVGNGLAEQAVVR